MMESAAIIDLGTNTFHLLLVEKHPETRFIIKEKITEPVKLGKGGIHKKTIIPEAFARGIVALEKFADILRDYDNIPVFAFGTSALRDAKNSGEFIKEAKEKTGINIKVITGKEEALLIHKGVKMAFPTLPMPAFILDIGGGSAEIIMTNGDEIDFAETFDIGASRLLGLFNPSDPISEDEILEIKSFLKVKLQPAINNANFLGDVHLIGSSGSFETFAEILYSRGEIDINPLSRSFLPLPMAGLTKIFDELVKANYDQRMKIPGMAIMRVEMIVMAVLITQVILENTRVSQVWLSDYAMKEGMITSILEDGSII
ncbi:MAG: exopolyphosphatase/guanosine-5'-triphosphate,3'-diphosphate pyrophosphatase [Sphingobacteriales bacterium]|jgi:exopolyphosphatase/guanosine-5'-triphosphate,3'-diphosphate pyrophosphatase